MKTPPIIVFIIMVIFLYFFNCSDFNKSENKSDGLIKGSFFENGKPCSLRINLHNAQNKLFLKYASSGNDGNFVFSGLDYGSYYLITHPADKGTEMPLQWRTQEINISKKSPEYDLSPVDGWSVNVIKPFDCCSFDLSILKNYKHLAFQWTPYCTEAQYEIEITDIFNDRVYKSGLIENHQFFFNGFFPDSTKLSKGVYRWTLKVLPKNNEWMGLSNFYDFSIGETCDHQVFGGTYVELDFPGWYTRVIQKFDLVNFLDKCYLLTTTLNAGQVPILGPKLGEKQKFFYDKKIMFAYSGQPIHLGKKFIDGKSIPFSILLHEMAHNFQIGGLPGFPKILLDDKMNNNNAGFCFSEGLATLNSMYVAEKILQENVSEEIKIVIENDRKKMIDTYSEALNYYEKSGNDYIKLTPDVVDGIFYYLGNKYSWDIFSQFFKIFQENKNTDKIYNLVQSKESKMLSVIIGSLSVACKDDLREKFLIWGFPFDDQFYRTIYPLIQKSLTQN